MAEDKQINTEGWHVVLAVIALLVLIGYLYYQAKQHPQTGQHKSPLERLGIPRFSRTPAPSSMPSATPVKVR